MCVHMSVACGVSAGVLCLLYVWALLCKIYKCIFILVVWPLSFQVKKLELAYTFTALAIFSSSEIFHRVYVFEYQCALTKVLPRNEYCFIEMRLSN